MAESDLGVLASQCLDRRIADKQILRPRSHRVKLKNCTLSSGDSRLGLSNLSWHGAGTVAFTGTRDSAMSRVEVLSGPERRRRRHPHQGLEETCAHGRCRRAPIGLPPVATEPQNHPAVAAIRRGTGAQAVLVTLSGRWFRAGACAP